MSQVPIYVKINPVYDRIPCSFWSLRANLIRLQAIFNDLQAELWPLRVKRSCLQAEPDALQGSSNLCKKGPSYRPKSSSFLSRTVILSDGMPSFQQTVTGWSGSM